MRHSCRHKPLSGGFFVAARAVELPCAVKTGEILEFEGLTERKRIDAIVFNSVCCAEKFGVLKTGYTVDYSELNILRQGRRKPLQIHFVSFSSARLDKYLMSLLLGEADYFILNARAIARADAVDFARIQGERCRFSRMTCLVSAPV